MNELRPRVTDREGRRRWVETAIAICVVGQIVAATADLLAYETLARTPDVMFVPIPMPVVIRLVGEHAPIPPGPSSGD
jgi:hypothetical protein